MGDRAGEGSPTTALRIHRKGGSRIMVSTPWDPEGATVLLDAEGRLGGSGAAPAVDLRQLYKLLVAARCLDARLAREELPMWASAAGEEAPLVAVAMVANDEDWIYPGLRDAAVALARGVPYDAIAGQVIGHNGVGGPALPARLASAQHRIATTTDSLGLHLALAAGQAHAQKLAQSDAVTFALFGEATSTTGAFHESMMLAASCDLPLVFVCRSQLWPNGAPAEAGLVGDSAADRARTSGLWSRRIDGADPLAVHSALTSAAKRAREGKGSAFIEVVVTPLYRDPPAHRDPVERLRRHLDHQGEWTQTFQDVVEAEARGGLDRAFSGQHPEADA